MRIWFFTLIHRLATRAPVLTVLVSLALAAALGVYGALNMQLITDQDKLISEELEYHKRYMDFIRRFGDLEFLYVVIEGETRDDMAAFAESLAQRLSRSPDIEEIVFRFETGWVRDFALLYAEEDQLTEMAQELQANRGAIEELSEIDSVDAILRNVRDAIANPRAGNAQPESLGRLQQFVNALGDDYQDPYTDFYSFEEELDRELPEKVEYLWSERGDSLLMLVMPSKDFSTLSVIEKPLQRIRADIHLTEMEFDGRVTAGLTGRPALQADEMATTNQDMQRASLIALVGVSILFSLFFREVTRPLLTMLALVLALGWTYGFVALTLGHLNLLSTVFALVLIGLGVDFGIHFLHRYQEELRTHANIDTAVWNSLERVGRGILTGAATSSVAFLLALFTDFLGLAELGFVAGIGILFCLAAMLITLPALLVCLDRYVHRQGKIPYVVHLGVLEHGSRYPRILLAIILLLTIVFIMRTGDVRFNDNLLDLQAEGLESVEYEHKLLEQSEYSTWYCAFTEPDMESVRETVTRLEQTPTVAKVQSLADVLPTVTDAKKQQLQAAERILTPVLNQPEEAYDPQPALYRQTWRALDEFFVQIESMQQTDDAAPADIPNLSPEQLQSLSPEQRAQLQAQQEAQPGSSQGQNARPPIDPQQAETLRQLYEYLSGPPAEVEQRLRQANQRLIEKPRDALRQIAEWSQANEPALADLPAVYRSLYVGNDQSLLVMAFPKENIWEIEAMREFIDDMRAIDPEVTGTPIQVYESSMLMREAFVFIGGLSIIVVSFFVLLDFRRLEALFFVVGPLLLGVLWLVEMMGWLSLDLNLANFFAIPILIGIGVDNAVHFYHRFLETRQVERTMSTTGTTLTLTTLTTLTGFGSLILASHKGLASLGGLMALGTLTCWFACVIVLSSLLKTFYRRS